MTTGNELARPARIGLCGLGGIGKAVARLLLDHRSGYELVAAATKEPADIGRSLRDVSGASAPGGGGDVVVGDGLEHVLAAQPDVILYMTGSFLSATGDDVVAVAQAGIDLVSPCEELAFPYGRFADDARRIDTAARAAGATILGTGVNPGFMFDALLAAASGVSWDIPAIRGRRVVDVAGFGQNIHLRLGIGYTPQEFESGHADGSIAGHVGFPESIELVCARLGVQLDGPVQETFEPMVAETDAPTLYGAVAAGRTEGFVQRAVGSVGGAAFVQLELVLHLRPEQAGMRSVDHFEIDGLHPVRLTLDPGMDAIPATAAQIVNSVPGVLQASPGLKSVTDLPASAAWLGGLPTKAPR
ncbi:hypothetical protein [Conexibacter sp. CPCC 206217]|uniref:hypothetical protein n=1 Tax=Conexibacter sp. CPCC 206217 TaxID=3064574 RepID=UPI002715F9FA|nr:hypothetical protein [Conexibacter sp. CPCC 206217]MDO8209563.1 hypothetical protein [Conexibacter sp. CPCC 206217]